MATQTGPATVVNGAFNGTLALPSGIDQVPPVLEAEGSLTVTIRYTPKGTEWRAIIVADNGTRLLEVPDVEFGPIRFELNGIEDTSVRVPITSPAVDYLADAPDAQRELQIWRGDQLVFFGPLVSPSSDGRSMSCTARGPAWHLSRRHVGDERENLLTNPNFASGLSGWQTIKGTFRGWALTSTSTPGAAEINTSRTYLYAGTTRSLRIDPTSTGVNTYIQAFQDVTVTAPSKRDLDVYFTAYAYIPDGVAVGEQQRGLLLQRLPEVPLLGFPLAYYAENFEAVHARITGNFPTGVWRRLQAKVTVPAGETNLIHAVLGVPGPAPAEVFWARCELYADEGVGNGPVDQADIIEDLVEHAQDAQFGKSDVNLTAVPQPTGVQRDRFYPYAEHQNIWRAIREFTTLSDGVDVWVSVTPTERFLNVKSVKGRQRNLPTLQFGDRGAPNCRLIRWTRDGEAAASRVWALGSGGGSTREEGFSEDDSVFGGLTLEDITVADAEVTVDGLAGIAAEHRRVVDDPLVVEVETFPEFASSFMYELVEGDQPWVRGVDQGLSVDARFRVVSRVLNPGSETVRFVLNGA